MPAARHGLVAKPPPEPSASASPAGRSSAPRVTATATGASSRWCRVDGADVNARMVEQGWAVAYRKYSTDYVSHETAAKAARRGLWRGDFVEPSRWRRGERLGATACGRWGRLPHQGEHQQEGHAHLPRAGRGVVREDAHRHGEGGAMVLQRGGGPRGGVAAGEAVRSLSPVRFLFRSRPLFVPPDLR